MHMPPMPYWPIPLASVGLIAAIYWLMLMLIPNGQPGFMLGFAGLLIVIAGTLWLEARRGALVLSDLGFRGSGFMGLGAAVVLALALGFCIQLLLTLLSTETRQALGEFNQVIAPVQNPAMILMTFITLVALVPIAEEVLFRGLIQTYAGQYMPPSLAIILTAVLFALFHFGALATAQGFSDQVLIFLALSAVGLAAGFLRQSSGSLLPAILLHGAYNGQTLFGP